MKNPMVRIADVDCTDAKDGEPLCASNGVDGYPTLKYFDSTTGVKGERWEGPRSYKSLVKFVKKRLKLTCDPGTLLSCDDKEKEYIESVKGYDQEKLKAEREELRKSIKDLSMEKRRIFMQSDKQMKNYTERQKSADEQKAKLARVAFHEDWKIPILEAKIAAKKAEL
mmetsp:Transcript_75362/g.170613  ORF Transcript_75362/g.170613 Transcript_75362/m.170613 type:complete len:168 (-) Transcript_75362:86-589(-)